METREEFIGLMQVLGESNARKVKDAMTTAIIENIQSACEEFWVIPPYDVEQMINDVGKEVAQKMKSKYRKALTANVEDQINKLFERKGESDY